MRIGLLFAVALLPGSVTLAASFDCQNARTNVEKLICADPSLEHLDSNLDAAYKTALRVGGPADKQQLYEDKPVPKRQKDPFQSQRVLGADGRLRAAY